MELELSRKTRGNLTEAATNAVTVISTVNNVAQFKKGVPELIRLEKMLLMRLPWYWKKLKRSV